MNAFWKSSWRVAVLGLGFFYLLSHLVNLTSLPVFADEAIYIRWSQLIIDDWQRYAFFPLNDGKTPLHMWLMVPFQFLFSDQVYAGRFLSVIVGLAQLLVNGYLVVQLGGRKKTALLAMLLTAMLPFWYVHHRMALIEALLTLWLSLTLVGVLRVAKSRRLDMTGLILTGVSFGLALWTKVPAVLFIPAFFLWACWPNYRNLRTCAHKAGMIGLGLSLGIGLFVLMALHPTFGQLFNRGGDFLYPWQEVMLQGKWRDTLSNMPTYFMYFGTYLTFPFLFLTVAGLFAPSHKRTIHLLFWSGILFVLPIAVLGIVVYPRYLFPATLFFTLAGAVSIQAYIDAYFTQATQLYQKVLTGLIMALLLANTLATSATFIAFSLFAPERTPFVAADRAQYLLEWSSGHGLKETADVLKARTKTERMAVATEGYFGSLPDGLLLYFHRQNVDNLYIEGIGQPVQEIPETFLTRAQEFDHIWLVVNSHRLNLELPQEKLLAEYCRPENAPCLQVWDITRN